MKSVKPGRGPSMMGGVMSIFMGLFGLLWTIIVASSGGGIFALFGVIFIAIAISQAVFHFKNATSKDRYSAFDIVDDFEESDPLNVRFGGTAPRSNSTTQSTFCPWCGDPVEDRNHRFCDKCGKKLP